MNEREAFDFVYDIGETLLKMVRKLNGSRRPFVILQRL